MMSLDLQNNLPLFIFVSYCLPLVLNFHPHQVIRHILEPFHYFFRHSPIFNANYMHKPLILMDFANLTMSSPLINASISILFIILYSSPILTDQTNFQSIFLSKTLSKFILSFTGSTSLLLKLLQDILLFCTDSVLFFCSNVSI